MSTYADAQEAADHVRKLYFARDRQYGYAEGKRLIERFPDDVRLRAWTVLNAVGSGHGDDGLTLAKQLVADSPDDPWARFAMAGALTWAGDTEEAALDASKKSLAAAPSHPDFVWLHAEALLNHAGERKAIEYVDRHLSELDNRAELLALKGYALNVLAGKNEGDPSLKEQAAAAYAAAYAADSTSFNAWWLQGIQLLSDRRIEDARPLLRRAAQLSSAPAVHRRYWRAVQGLTTLTAEEKAGEIEEDMQLLLDKRPDDPDVLFAAANAYGDLGLDTKKKAIERGLLEDHPVTAAAEWVLVNRYRSFARKHGKALLDDATIRQTYVEMLQEFIARPEHVQDRLLGDAYRELFDVIRDDTTISVYDLLGTIDGMVASEGINPHITYAGGAMALAERKTHFRKAERLTHEGLEAVRERLIDQQDSFDTPGDYENAFDYLTSILYDARGWVYFKEGRLEDAKTELLRAYDLHQESPDNLYHLGKLHEAIYASDGAHEEVGGLPIFRLYPGDHPLGKAEGYYIDGLAVPSPGENPNEDALRDLYRRRYGSLDGYGDYRARIEEIDRRQRKETVLSSRIGEPEPVVAFNLTTLKGDSLASAALNGKTTVINFWGIWCGWCVREMPDIQQLHDLYADSADVMILTINNDANPDEVAAWMEENNYDLSVLFDRGYASQRGIRVYPTTWFIDPEGRIAFIKQGWSEELVEEFVWRIEALRAGE